MPSGIFRHLQARLEQGVLVVTLIEPQIEGEEVAERLRTDLLTALDQHPATHVVIDFQHTRYLSSVAFRPLLQLWRRLHPLGGRIVVCGLNKVVGDIFYTTKMINNSGSQSTIFEMADDVPAALAKLTGSAPDLAAPGSVSPPVETKDQP